MRRTTNFLRFAFASSLLAVGALCSSSVFAQVTFKPLVTPGETSKATADSRTAQVLTIAGMDFETGSDSSTVSVTQTGQKAADGTITATTKIESLKANVNAPMGLTLNFDS